jgi:hypothetical protein
MRVGTLAKLPEQTSGPSIAISAMADWSSGSLKLVRGDWTASAYSTGSGQNGIDPIPTMARAEDVGLLQMSESPTM